MEKAGQSWVGRKPSHVIIEMSWVGRDVLRTVATKSTLRDTNLFLRKKPLNLKGKNHGPKPPKSFFTIINADTTSSPLESSTKGCQISRYKQMWCRGWLVVEYTTTLQNVVK
jgi:hypothetical protein